MSGLTRYAGRFAGWFNPRTPVAVESPIMHARPMWQNLRHLYRRCSAELLTQLSAWPWRTHVSNVAHVGTEKSGHTENSPVAAWTVPALCGCRSSGRALVQCLTGVVPWQARVHSTLACGTPGQFLFPFLSARDSPTHERPFFSPRQVRRSSPCSFGGHPRS